MYILRQSSIFRQKNKIQNSGNVVAEIEYLVKTFKVKEIHFEDDNFTLKRDNVEKICRLLIERKINVNWACPNGIRADEVNEEIIQLMKDSGCYYFAYGIESANPQILKNTKKENR